MDLQQKIGHLTHTVLEEAAKERDAILTRLDQESKEACDAYEMSVLKNAYGDIQESIGQATRKRMETVSQKTMEKRKELLSRREEMIREIEDGAVKKLMAFVKTPDYITWIKTHLEQALSGTDKKEAQVNLMEGDPAKDALIAEGYAVQEVCEEWIGGFYLEIPARKMMIDQTFSGRVSECRAKFHEIRLEDAEVASDE